MEEFAKSNTGLRQTMQSHLINDLETFGVWSDDYETFLRKRAEAVSEDLKTRLIKRPVDAVGQSARSDDVAEEMAAFE
jgi:hypothetical protein